MKRWIILTVALGMIASCAPAISDSGLCSGLKRPMGELRAGLEAHPETPEAVGAPATDAVLGFEAGCGD